MPWHSDEVASSHQWGQPCQFNVNMNMRLSQGTEYLLFACKRVGVKGSLKVSYVTDSEWCQLSECSVDLLQHSLIPTTRPNDWSKHHLT